MKEHPSTAFDHWQCGLRALAVPGQPCARRKKGFGDAERHFRRAIELAEKDGSNFTLASALVSCSELLLCTERQSEAIEMLERRMSLPKFKGEDGLERRCIAEHLESLKAGTFKVFLYLF